MTKKLQGVVKRRKEIEAEKAHAKGWVPVRRGARFCSPLCGARCTHQAYLKAQVRALELVKRLGNGWSVLVWENLAWHWAVVRGPVMVRVNSDGNYRAELGDAGHQYFGEGETPIEALRAMEARAQSARVALESLVDHGTRAVNQALDHAMSYRGRRHLL